MSRRKCVFGCDGTLNLFSFPKDPAIKGQWMKFVFRGQQRSCVNVLVCSRHFMDGYFTNKAQYDAGFSDRLKLKVGAVPTLEGHESKPHASSSGQVPTSHVIPGFRLSECQAGLLHTVSAATQACVPKTSIGTQFTCSTPTRSVATQLSFGTLKPFVQSKGTQVTAIVATGTTKEGTQMQLSSTLRNESTSGLCARPTKRPHIELLEEEDVRCSDNPVPHDSTYKPGDSVTEPSEISGMEACSDYNDTKYIVFERSLKELFERCPVCKCVCDVQQQQLGTFVSFSQVCGHCQYSRKWQSQPVKGTTPLGNLQMSAAVYFTNGSFFHMEKICKAMKLQIHQYETFKRHAQMFMETSIHHKSITELLLECEEEELEPWQIPAPQVHVKEDDVGELTDDYEPESSSPPRNKVNISPPNVKTETPQPAVSNSQELIVTVPQLISNTNSVGIPEFWYPSRWSAATYPEVMTSTVVPSASGGVQSHVPDAYGAVQSHVPDAYGAVQSHVPDAYGAVQSQVPDAYGAVQSQVPDAYGAVQSQAPDAYGAVQSQAPDAYGAVQSQAPDAYGAVQSQVPDAYGAVQSQVPVSSIQTPAVHAASSNAPQPDQSNLQILSVSVSLPCFTVLNYESGGTQQ